MNKILEAAKQALEVAKCDHHLVPMDPDVKDQTKFQKWYCDQCQAIFYLPVGDSDVHHLHRSK